MAQKVKALAAKTEDLSSIPGTHKVEGRIDSHKLTFNHMCAVLQACTHTSTHTHKKSKTKTNL